MWEEENKPTLLALHPAHCSCPLKVCLLGASESLVFPAHSRAGRPLPHCVYETNLCKEGIGGVMGKSLHCQISLGNTAHSALGIHNAQWLLEGVEMSSLPLVISKVKSQLLDWSLKLAPLCPTDVICLAANSSQLFPNSVLSIPTSGLLSPSSFL